MPWHYNILSAIELWSIKVHGISSICSTRQIIQIESTVSSSPFSWLVSSSSSASDTTSPRIRNRFYADRSVMSYRRMRPPTLSLDRFSSKSPRTISRSSSSSCVLALELSVLSRSPCKRVALASASCPLSSARAS